ncbi:MAG TPA: sugar phosphate isomerase/epimerase family protein [Bryobacterales bacterium]|nr:sugar phosphate isomerase/epimerase family protein [Bryobacterales bacterium]
MIPFRLAICNEVFEKRDFAESCRILRKAGWQGIEIAPFTLAENATTVSAARRKDLRDIMASEGVAFTGLHWLMVGPPGLHVTTPDDAVRRRSWEYVAGLIDLCGDLGARGVMVFGSPNQRGSTGGLSAREATANFIEGLAGVAPRAVERGVTICIEPLSAAQTDVLLTLEEAVSIVNQLASPAIRTMYDSHNAIDEVEPHEKLVDRYFEYLYHIHVNEMDGTYPRPGGGHDFKPVLQVLKDRGYTGWVSMEVFDFSPGAEKIVSEAGAYLRDEMGRLR